MTTTQTIEFAGRMIQTRSRAAFVIVGVALGDQRIIDDDSVAGGRRAVRDAVGDAFIVGYAQTYAAAARRVRSQESRSVNCRYAAIELASS